MAAQNQTDPNIEKSQPGERAALPDPNSPAEIHRAKSLHQAEAARMFSIPVHLSAMMGEADLDGLGAKFYMDMVKLEAGTPKDPIERMLLEQMVLVHHQIAMMHTSAAKSKSVEAIKVNYSMLARMMGEFRRLALAIRIYRQPPAQKSFSVVKQQNVVANGEQTVTYVTGRKKKETLSARCKQKRKKPDGIEQRINGDGNLNKEPKTRRGRSKERSVTAALDG